MPIGSPRSTTVNSTNSQVKAQSGSVGGFRNRPRCIPTNLPRSALPGRPDRRPSPARAEAAAIVAAADKSGPAEIVQLAVIAVILGCVVRLACDGSLPAVDGDGIVRRLMIAGQEAVAVP